MIIIKDNKTMHQIHRFIKLILNNKHSRLRNQLLSFKQ